MVVLSLLNAAMAWETTMMVRLLAADAVEGNLLSALSVPKQSVVQIHNPQPSSTAKSHFVLQWHLMPVKAVQAARV
jgi:hypothetical protein